MHKSILFILALLFTGTSFAQTYTVLDIRGTAVKTADGTTLARGVTLEASDALTFEANTMIALCSAEKGRAMIKAADPGEGKVSDLAKAGVAKVTAESPATFGSDLAFKTYFSPNEDGPFYKGHFVFIGEMNWYKVNGDKYPMDSNHFFFVRYDYEGTSVNKGLPFDREEFALERKELYSSAGKYVVEDQDVLKFGEFLYYDGEEYRLLCSFRPYFVDKDDLKEIVGLMKPWLDTKADLKARTQEVQAFIADMYGKAGRGDVEQFLLRNIPGIGN